MQNKRKNSLTNICSRGGYYHKNNSLKPEKLEIRNKRKIIFIVLILSIFFLAGVYLYKTYAVFSEEKHFNVINGTVQDPGDIYFAYYVGGNITREFPKQNSGYTLDVEKSSCTNGVTISWDDTNWSVNLNYKNYNATDYTRTKCNLYFKDTNVSIIGKTFSDGISTLALNDKSNLATDDYGNIRYIGSNPNNYVKFVAEDELWRIIGVMKDVLDGTGNKEDRVKIIRSASIGKYSWDSSDSSVNGGLGINEWSQADLMKLMNPGYENESGRFGGSLYWRNTSGRCYNGMNDSSIPCIFSTLTTDTGEYYEDGPIDGISSAVTNKIGDAVWNTGSQGKNSWQNTSDGLVKNFYDYERSTNTGKTCTFAVNGAYCNDTVERTTTWTGKVGLMYPSDYGYATSGGATTDRATCLNTPLVLWGGSGVSDCKNNNWLYTNTDQWTMMPSAFLASRAFFVSSDGLLPGVVGMRQSGSTSTGLDVFPTVYLLPSIKVASGTGSEEDPYILSL